MDEVLSESATQVGSNTAGVAADSSPPVLDTAQLLEQHPTLALLISALTLLAIVFLIGSLASWTFLALRARRGQSWLPVEPWRPRVWGLADVMIVAVLVVGCQSLAASTYVRFAGADRASLTDILPVEITTAASLGSLLAVALTLAWMSLRYQVAPAHVGLGLKGLPRHLVIGIIATLATLPLVYLVMAAVSVGLKTDYDHPLLDKIKETASLKNYLLGVVTAVILAPLTEEFLFRVILQGWLQSWQFSSLKSNVLGASEPERLLEMQCKIAAAASTVPYTQESDPQPEELPSAAESQIDNGAASIEVSAIDDAYFNVEPPWWPAIATGILFGLAHWGYGLSFIPLIVLGIILGILYRATHSIWPCLVVHLALNGSSMAGLGIGIMLQQAGAK